MRREIIMPSAPREAKESVSGLGEQVFSEKIEEHPVKIYPNPTKGLLRVSVSGLKGTDKCSIAVFTTGGAKVMSRGVSKCDVDINLSNRPNGVYLLKIIINDSSTTWKIIKE